MVLLHSFKFYCPLCLSSMSFCNGSEIKKNKIDPQHIFGTVSIHCQFYVIIPCSVPGGSVAKLSVCWTRKQNYGVSQFDPAPVSG